MERFPATDKMITDRGTEPDVEGSESFPGLPGRFCMYYLPELDLAAETITRSEALLRWWHPSYGMLRPGPSLGGTRWTDQVCEIEQWAMMAVCEQAAAWNDRDNRIETSLNVSAAHLLHPHFLASIDRALGATGLDPTTLTIDVPFGALAMDPFRVARVTERVALRGVNVAIDGVNGVIRPDLLKGVNISALKIELRFRGWRNPGLHQTVEDAVARAHAAGAVAVAKAVEDDRTLNEVRAIGFDRAFGHTIGTAVTAAQVQRLFRPCASRRAALFGPACPVSV